MIRDEKEENNEDNTYEDEGEDYAASPRRPMRVRSRNTAQKSYAGSSKAQSKLSLPRSALVCYSELNFALSWILVEAAVKLHWSSSG